MTDRTKQYPIGKFTFQTSYTEEELRRWITTIEIFPALLEEEIIALNEQQIDTPYREGGWTVRQVVHHCADSPLNIRR